MQLQEQIKCSRELRAKVQEVLENETNHHQSGKPVVAVFGMMNAGKSSLLNMLTEHISDDYFAIGDVRTTADNQKYEFGNYIYLDTPGLDANDADNVEATKGVAKADIVLFTHQPPGELDAAEVKALKTLKDSFGEYANDNIIIVLTKIDKQEPEKVEQIMKRISEQCQDFDFMPKMISVSNTRYQKGIAENKRTLIKESRIIDLKEQIDAVNVNVTAIRQIRAINYLKDLKAELQTQKSMLWDVIKDQQRTLNDSCTQMEELKSVFYEMIESFFQNKREYRSL